MLNYPTIRHLRAFTAVARLGSFGQAADELCISQSALSQNISQLEEILEVRLIDRTTRSMQLTEVGEQLYPRAIRWLNEMEDIFTDLQDQGRLRRGHVRIACLASVAIRILPLVVEAFRAEHPMITVSIRDDTGFGVESRIIQREADFGVAGGPVRNPAIEFERMYDEPYRLLCGADHPLASEASVKWSQIAEHDYIALGDETNIGRQLKLTLDAADKLPRAAHEVSQLGTVWGLVDKGLGVSALPASACPEHGHFKTKELTNPKVQRQVGILTVRERSLMPAASLFLEMLRNTPAEVEV